MWLVKSGQNYMVSLTSDLMLQTLQHYTLHYYPSHVPVAVLLAGAKACLLAEGASEENAQIVAEVLVAADCRGVPSHGVNRLEIYCSELRNKLIDGHQTATVFEGLEEAATATVRFHNR
jgi:LDH2 family malate/lactate/ureidoglycolate dehydrogenase